MNRSSKVALLTIWAMMALVVGAVAFNVPRNFVYALERAKLDAQRDARADRLAKLDPQIKMVQSMSEVFNAVTQVVEPSVVHISSERTTSTPAIPPELRRFFGDGGGDDEGAAPFRFRQPKEQLVTATGSGVIITADGFVLTNNHVVAGSSRVTVKLPGDDGETYDAKVIGTDPKTDVAVIKITGAKDLPAAQLGDSDAVRVGDWVLAIGSPFGLDRTVTAGIISAKGRANVGIADYEDFMQTDASINPGNSGGPLVDVTGKVIGINAAIASRSGGNQGVGFTIPINLIKQLLPRLEKGEQIQRGYLGVLIQPLDKKLAESFGFDSTHGAVVTEMLPDSPSKDVLKKGDIIYSVNGENVKDPNDLRTAVANFGPGKEVKLGVFRDRKKTDVTIKLGELPNTAPTIGSGGESPSRHSTKEVLGIEIQTLTPELAKQLGYDKAKGVVVTSVEPTSQAAREQLAAGDLITEVQGTAVSSVDEFNAALDKLKDAKSVRLLVTSRRGGGAGATGSRFVLLPLNK